MIKKNAHPKERRAVIALTILTCVWGTTFSIVQDALPDISAALFAAIRFGLALSIFLFFFSSARKGLRLLFRAKTTAEKKLRFNGAILGVALGTGYILQFLGLLTTTTSKSAFLTATTVLWTPLFAQISGYEKLRARKIITVLMAATGIILLTHPFPVDGVVIGDVFSALCAVAFGIYILWLDRTYPYAKEAIGGEVDSVIAISAIQLAIGFVTIAICIPFTGPIYFHLTGRAEFALIYTTVLATAASSFIQAYYQKDISPTSAVLIYTLEPVVTALIGFFLIGETMTPIEFGGCALIIAAMLSGQ